MALPGEPAPAGAAPALALILAVSRNGTIGANDALPWRLPEDLKRFRVLTTGHAIIMGRKTWNAIGRALPERQNIVVTRNPGFAAANVDVAHSLDEALAKVALPPPAFCIGGAELFRTALPRAAVLHLTEIERDFPGDTFLPAFDRSAWVEVARESHRHPGPEGFDYAFVTYARRE